MKLYVKYYATLVGLYIVITNGSKFGTVIQKGAEGTATVTRALQGQK